MILEVVKLNLFFSFLYGYSGLAVYAMKAAH